MKIGFLGSGAWAMALIKVLDRNGNNVLIWSIEEDVLDALEKEKKHPKFEGAEYSDNISVTKNLADIHECDCIIECVTAKGLRPVLENLLKIKKIKVPFILSSKGIETTTEKILSEVAQELLGEKAEIGYVSGPTLADEVLKDYPTSAVAGSLYRSVQELIIRIFENEHFRVVGSYDLHGVALGGAMKNIIAIAAGMATGMGYGFNTKAMILTKGLAELKQMARIKNCKEETMDTLSGIGDLIVTGVTPLSRNYRYGVSLGEGIHAKAAKDAIPMVVEGTYTVKAAYQLMQESDKHLIITDCVYKVIHEGLHPKEAIAKILHF